jgi:mono/diheme cytochrome c family protein
MHTIFVTRCRRAGALAVMVAGLAAGSAFAQDDALTAMRAAQGLEIAKLWCAQCHDVENGVMSDVVTEAPGFHQIANMDGMTQTRVQMFLTQPTHPMPDLNLAREEIETLAIYILSLRETPAGE